MTSYEERFFAKFHMLTDVLPEQKLYTAEVNSMAHRNVLLSVASDTSSAMVAFAKLWAISYIGNHNIDNGYFRLIVLICSVKFVNFFLKLNFAVKLLCFSSARHAML